MAINLGIALPLYGLQIDSLNRGRRFIFATFFPLAGFGAAKRAAGLFLIPTSLGTDVGGHPFTGRGGIAFHHLRFHNGTLVLIFIELIATATVRHDGVVNAVFVFIAGIDQRPVEALYRSFQRRFMAP